LSEEFEFDTKTIPLDEKLHDTLEELQREGWQVVPGTVPVVVYSLTRPKSSAKTFGAHGTLGIDDTKVFILRDGELIPGA
jgi:hypothetical protein